MLRQVGHLEVPRHAFFKGFNLEALGRGEARPPWTPKQPRSNNPDYGLQNAQHEDSLVETEEEMVAGLTPEEVEEMRSELLELDVSFTQEF